MKIDEVSGYTLKPREKKIIDKFFSQYSIDGLDFSKSNIGLEIVDKGKEKYLITGFRTTIAEVDFKKLTVKKGNKIGGNMSQTLLNYVVGLAKKNNLKDVGFMNESTIMDGADVADDQAVSLRESLDKNGKLKSFSRKMNEAKWVFEGKEGWVKYLGLLDIDAKKFKKLDSHKYEFYKKAYMATSDVAEFEQNYLEELQDDANKIAI